MEVHSVSPGRAATHTEIGTLLGSELLPRSVGSGRREDGTLTPTTPQFIVLELLLQKASAAGTGKE